MVSPIVIAGPTASGKSAFAMALAERLGGELICADSRQVYANMTVGTAAPTIDELKRVPHHGYGMIDPDQSYDAGQFVMDADRFINDICARQRVPILVGGTGLYLRAFRFGMGDVPPRDDAIRIQLENETQQIGVAGLYEELLAIDAEAAAKIAPADEFRIIRALEIMRLTGKKASALRQSHFNAPARVHALWILLDPSKDWLNPRIEQRVINMFDEGLVEEALALKAHLKIKTSLLTTMGYEEALLLADGHFTKEQAIEKTVIRHRQFAKRQMTWFKKEPWWTRIDPATDDFFSQFMNIWAPVK